MKSHMFRTDLLDDPIVQPAKSIRVPCLACAWRWEQIRIRRVTFMFFYRPSHRPSLRLRILPSPLARRFGIVSTSFDFCQHPRLPQAQPNRKSNFPSGAFLLLTLLSHSENRNWFLNGRKELPNRSSLSCFLHAATVGGRGVCVVQTCTDARSACKTAHVGTTRPTPRSKRLR